MPRKGWADKEEQEFLKSFIPEYEECQVNRRYKNFWLQVNAEFLAKFPVIDKLFPGMKPVDLNPEQKEMYTAHLIKQQQVCLIHDLFEMSSSETDSANQRMVPLAIQSL